MVVLGLGDDKKSDKDKKKSSKSKKKQDSNNSQADEAKKLLEQMEAKKEANPDDCVFC